jgi:hypothetical protein
MEYKFILYILTFLIDNYLIKLRKNFKTSNLYVNNIKYYVDYF